MNEPKQSADQYSEEEATRRMNEALKRALSMPPKPHKPPTKRAKKKRSTRRPTG